MMHPLRLSLQFARLATPGPHRAALPRQSVARWIRHALAREAEITVRIVDAYDAVARLESDISDVPQMPPEPSRSDLPKTRSPRLRAMPR